MTYTKDTYCYYYYKEGVKYKVSNFYVESTTYNATMVHLTFAQALETNKSELVE